MISISVAATVGAAIGATVLGVASAMSNGAIGLDMALSHIPSGTQGYSVASAVKDALVGGVAGGGIGATIAAAAKSLAAH
jgi:hypothetical protein